MFPSEEEITCNALEKLIQSDEDFVLVDCREADEYAFCRLNGAQLIPLSQFQVQATRELSDTKAKIIIYCHHGVRSLYATQFLRDQGYTNTYSLSGGIDLWSIEIDSSIPRY